MSVYKNGNTIVEIRDDGTKIRYTPDRERAMPIYPESIDLKITNKCNVGCRQCHEQSCPEGKQGDLFNPLLKSLHPYTELAIGGGDPMTHPGLEQFLVNMKKQKVICNLTVHWRSFMENKDTLRKWTDDELIHGLGVSINEKVPQEVIDELSKFEHAVIHTIVGIADEATYNQLVGNDFNILLLGYKTFGRGIKYRFDESFHIDINTIFVRENITRFPNHFRAVCFDNLAIEQLELVRKMKPEMFNQMYMGGDGAFTMYVDLVENKYAVSSTSHRFNIDSDNIDELFSNVRNVVNS